MKKILGGCLVLVLLFGIVAGGAAWWFVLRPAWNAGSQFMDSAKQIADLAQLEGKVRNRNAFTPPADGRLPEASLQSFIATQQHIRDQIGPELETLESRYREISRKVDLDGGEIGIKTVLGAYTDVFGLIHQAKQAQVDALNATGMSLAEYRWMRGQALAALVTEQWSESNGQAKPVRSENLERLQPHQELLKETAVLAWLGL